MNPVIRIVAIAAALAGVALIARIEWPAVATNLTAMQSWTRTQGEVRAMSGDVEFELGHDPETYRASAPVDHTLGLRLFKTVPLFVDPADRTHVKPAGVLQMWLSPAAMSVFILLLLGAAVIAAQIGTGQDGASTPGTWMFTESPGPLTGGILLHSPARQWKTVV